MFGFLRGSQNIFFGLMKEYLIEDEKINMFRRHLI
jgi:hypothetical protein